jgi:hypothetical protein
MAISGQRRLMFPKIYKRIKGQLRKFNDPLPELTSKKVAKINFSKKL